jgi:lysophospholipase L1-like esterase
VGEQQAKDIPFGREPVTSHSSLPDVSWFLNRVPLECGGLPTAATDLVDSDAGGGNIAADHMNHKACLLLFALLGPTLLIGQTPSQPPTTAIDPRWQIPASDEGLPGAGPLRRADWFRKVWAERRSAWAQRVERDQGALVFLGDSITQGWGDSMGGAFAGVKVANRGISGDTTRGVLIRLKEDVLALRPSGVVLLIGTNDLEEGADPEIIADNLKLILAALKAHHATMPVVLCQVFPSSASKKRPSDKIKKVNQLYAAAVKGDSQILYLETWPLFADDQGDAKAEEFPDLLHPNKAGYAKWAAAIRPILATLDFVEKEDDTFQPEAGFVSLFNGRDLTGWGFRTNAFDGRAESPDKRYVARHGRLIVTTPPEGRRIQQLWTTRQFSNNFTLKLEFRATPNADSGVFIRQPQLQCRDYWLAGPYKQLKSYRPQEWNEMIVTVKEGVAYCSCNGEVLEASLKVPSTGPIGLEGDRGQMEYRRIRLQELP